MKAASVFHPHTLTKQSATHLSLCLFTKADLGIEKVFIRCEPDNEELLVPMRKTKQGELLRWQGKIPISLHQDCTFYVFKLIYAQGQRWLSNEGIVEWTPTQERQFRHNVQHQPPAWVKKQIFYQIFPERFANGREEISVKTGEYEYQNGLYPVVQKAWHEKVEPSLSKKAAFEFYGGDLYGIVEKLPYLQELGFTALYLNPIFTSPSNHKYDCCDYFNVDPHFGGNQALAELSAGLHERGMRLLLDGVINHTSAEHPWMDKYGVGDGSGAYANESSPYRHFYNFDEHGYYWTWKGIESLPKLDLGQRELQDYFYAAEDSVLRHWMKPPYNIDGWRLDVAHMLGDGNSAKNNHSHFQAIKQAMRAENSESYLLGEHFHEASSWLQGEQEDAAMNYYGFLKPLRGFIAGSDIAGHPFNIDAQNFAQWLSITRGTIPFANQLAQFNLLDSHDTERFITVLKEDEAKLRLAIVLLFTYIGIPSVYYGDEVGLKGGSDPDCRRPFPWQEQDWDRPLLEHYQSMITLRKQHACLSEGDIITLYAQGDCLVFARWLSGAHIIVAINRGKACKLELDIGLLGKVETYQEWQTQRMSPVQAGSLSISLKTKSFLILTSL